MGTISARMFQQGPNYSQHCNQSGVSISTNLFSISYPNVNRRNYKLHVDRLTWIDINIVNLITLHVLIMLRKHI